MRSCREPRAGVHCWHGEDIGQDPAPILDPDYVQVAQTTHVRDASQAFTMEIGVTSVLILAFSAAHGVADTPTDDCVTGNWTVENQPPAHCVPYPKGLFQVKLPNAGKGGPTDHLAPDSDKIAANSLLMGDLNGTQVYCTGPRHTNLRLLVRSLWWYHSARA